MGQSLCRIGGQISDIAKSRQIIPKNEALDESFSKKFVSGSKKVTKGQKLRKKCLKGQILIFSKKRQIVPQNEALELSR